MLQPSPIGSVQPALRAHYLPTHKSRVMIRELYAMLSVGDVTIIKPTEQQAALVQFVQVQVALIEPQRQDTNDQMQVISQFQ